MITDVLCKYEDTHRHCRHSQAYIHSDGYMRAAFSLKVACFAEFYQSDDVMTEYRANGAASIRLFRLGTLIRHRIYYIMDAGLKY